VSIGGDALRDELYCICTSEYHYTCPIMGYLTSELISSYLGEVVASRPSVCGGGGLDGS
jgi:hypothetical protein